MPALACQGSSYCLLCGKNQIFVCAFVLLPFGLHHRPWSVVSWSGGPFRASDHPNFSQKALVSGQLVRRAFSGTQTSPKRPWSVVSWSGGHLTTQTSPKRPWSLGSGMHSVSFGPGRHSARALGPRGHSVRLWGCVSWCFMAQGCILCGLGERVNGPSRLHNHCCKILIAHGIFYFSVWFGPRECNSMQFFCDLMQLGAGARECIL